MESDDLAPGQLVRYLETKSRWYLARVRRMKGSEVELTFFGEKLPLIAPVTLVERLDEFFDQRERVFSVERLGLTYIFYARAIERLRASRVREMQRVLRKAGVSFEPEDWPRSDTRIRLWRDESFVAKDGKDSTLDGLLPQWLDPFVLPSGSRDPLGLQAPAERLVNEVLPGLTVFTYRAGYYGFLPWAIRYVNGLAPTAVPPRTSRRDLLNLLERTLVLCEFVHHGIEDDSCRLIGQRSKLRVLSGAEGDRYRVPESILKNQNSAGGFRLFATSLVSLGLMEEADDLAVDGLVPYRLTPQGEAIAGAFAKCLDRSFADFGLGDRAQPRNLLRVWGKDLCFSSVARQKRFRDSLLHGLLLGNSLDAEKRFRTVAHLYAEGLLNEEMLAGATEGAEDALSEEDASLLEGDIQGAGLANRDVVLHFYTQPPREDLRSLQALAVFELLSLGLSAIFQAALKEVTDTTRTDSGRLVMAMAGVPQQAKVWAVPMRSAKPKPMTKLVEAIFHTEDHIAVASLGGAILIRLLRDPLLQVVWDTLTQFAEEPLELFDSSLRQHMEQALSTALPGLLKAMVERHEMVSDRKNRQRWMCFEGSALVRDDPQAMGVGFHALRFPQLASLARDVRLSEEDLRRG